MVTLHHRPKIDPPINFEGKTWLEWGYRLVRRCRGLAYAAEASQALLAKVPQIHADEPIMASGNVASQSVCRKPGFKFWKQAPVDGVTLKLYPHLSQYPAPQLGKRQT